MRQLYALLSRRRRWQLVGLFVLMIVGAVAEMATIGAVVPFLAMLMEPNWAARFPAVGRLLTPLGATTEELLPWAGAAFALVAILSAVVRLLLYQVSYRITFGLGADIGGALYWRTLHRPYAWHVARNSSDVIAALEKVNSVTKGVFVQLVQGSVALLIGASILVMLLLIDATTALIAGGFFMALYVTTTLLNRSRLEQNSRSVAHDLTNRIRSVQEGLGGIRDVLLDGLQSVYHERFAAFDSRFRAAQASNAFIGAYPRVFMEAAGVILILALTWIMSGKPGGVAQAVPVLGALALGAQKLLPQMQLVYLAWTSLRGQKDQLDDVLALLEDHPQQATLFGPRTLSNVYPKRQSAVPLVELRDVSFRYHQDGQEVLSGINLEIPRGATVGIVGTTGCGKSTLMDLVMGLLQPSRGVILIDGEPLAPLTAAAWHARLAHVPQSIFLIDASIAENVALGTPLESIDPVRLRSAMEKAQLGEFVASLPGGHLTAVGERGVRLSGGQRQRIGLARALYKNAEVLILDEATSALDGQTEKLVMEAIDSRAEGRTTFMIAHRLSTIEQCDKIIVLHRGKVAGFDTWEVLLAANEIFQEIVAAGSHESKTLLSEADGAGIVDRQAGG